MARIGIDCRFYGTGFTGIGRYTAELVAGLAKITAPLKKGGVRAKHGRGDHEFVCFLNPAEFAAFKSPAKNIRAVRVNARHYSVAEQTTFLAAILKEKLDLMHFTHFNAPLLYPGKSVVTIHDLILSKFPGQKMTSRIHRAAYDAVIGRSVAHASQIIAVSEHTKKDLKQLLGVPAKKVSVVYNGVDPSWKPARAPAKIKKEMQERYHVGDDFLLYTGVWRDHKNLLGLLRALAILRSTSRFSGRLVITGKPDRVYAPAIYKTIDDLGLKGAVRVTGLVPDDDLVKLYQSARVFTFPSFYEGFGLPPLEAMAVGTPVAASAASCIPEIIGEKNAVFFDPKNPVDMARTIKKVWSDTRLRARLKKAGQKRAALFRWETMTRETLAVYEGVLKKD